jgi:Flp pilus assembly pilin Flp
MKLRSFAPIARRQTGAALIEYGLLVGLVAVAAIVSISVLGKKVDATFAMAATALEFDGAPIDGPLAATPWTEWSTDAITAVRFDPTIVEHPSWEWYGFYVPQNNGTILDTTGSPRITGSHFAHNVDSGRFHINFETNGQPLPAAFVANNYVACRTEANSNAFRADLSAAWQGLSDNMAYLAYTNVSFDELDRSKVAVEDLKPVICEIRPR